MHSSLLLAVDAPASSQFLPQTLLLYILIGILLGAAGQGVRAIVGLKQMNDQAVNTSTPVDELFSPRVLFVSFGIGAVAGVCAVLGLVASDTPWDKRSVLGIMAAGYAGADFIEGFITQYLPKAPTAPANAAAGGDPNAPAAKAEANRG